MARKNSGKQEIQDYRHLEAKRKNNPPAKIAAEGVVPLLPKAKYAYNPRLSPVLRFDPTGLPDKIVELVHEAQKRPLSSDETDLLLDALRDHEPWLEWTEKQEQHKNGFFEVDPVALHIHERVSAQAILKVAARQDIERSLFADPEQKYQEAVQFYQHDIDWTNRLILGDSLQVMSSLARREDLAGKVQMIYIDPPYGIKFASNFQPQIGKRDVKDREQDLTREPEMVKAYRDTWHLGIHSYLTYLRDRLIVVRELLADTGSIFVQIGDENIHVVRCLLDEIFGRENQVGLIPFVKTGGFASAGLKEVCDYLLWYARNASIIRPREIYLNKEESGEGMAKYTKGETSSGLRAPLSQLAAHSHTVRLLREDNATSQGNPIHSIMIDGHKFSQAWKTNPEGLQRLVVAGRLQVTGNTVAYIRYLDDFPVMQLTNIWTDIGGIQSRNDPKVYAVQTATSLVERCILMATEPGDLVLDPTCGSGTTAYVAERWGRRWISIDTSRVAVAIARQRLLTATYDYYELRNQSTDVADGLVYKTVPHVTLKSIAQNTNLDPIFAKHTPILDEKLEKCNAVLSQVTNGLRHKLSGKLLAKQKGEGKRAITDADMRRWKLPEEGKKWEHWEAPFDTDPDWPQPLQGAVTEYRKAWRAKMDEVNACIAANADQEELVDQPEVAKGVMRVSGPFTVEAVQPPEMSLGEPTLTTLKDEGLFGGKPEELEETFEVRMVETRTEHEARNLDAYLDQMIRYLRMDGVTFPNNKHNTFTRLERLESAEPGLHAEGRWVSDGEEDPDLDGRATVAVAFGPPYGPVTAKMVEVVIRSTSRMGYDDLVIAGFSFDGPAHAVIEEVKNPHLRVHAAHVRPDVNPGMNGLLKEQPGSQLFTVFGQPRTRIEGPDKNDEYAVVMEGVDVYDPVTNSIASTGANKVAAWFIDGDYDGRTFCITQAFFPNKSAWKKLAKALKGVIDEDAFESFSGTKSLPFPLGRNRCVAVKVIDPRGNEVMRVQKLGSTVGEG
jgi:adenine-specific DNA-methyltransferase